MDLSKYWKTIVDTLRDGLMVIDVQGRIVAANPAAERLTGYAAHELIGKSCRILNCNGCKIIGRGQGRQWCALYRKGTIRDKKCLITHKNRRTVHILKSASVLYDENGVSIGAVETMSDISENVRQRQEIVSLRKTYQLDDGYFGIIGKSILMQRMFELIENVAATQAPVMIQGESGTGKEMVARAIHESSERQKKPFIKVNCAALNENLLESELFGHVKGAFTGADRTRIGRFEAAHRGTVFLDEIGDIPLSIQVKLLRVLEDKRIERVGDHKSIPVNVRIITATNKNLDEMVKERNFREDLFFRINVFPLYCPALRERIEDLPFIVQHFIKRNNTKTNKKILGLNSEALEKLMGYDWPGNVRELRNCIEYAFVLCPGGGIGVKHLPPKILMPAHDYLSAHRDNPTFLKEREKLLKILKQVNGNQSQAARLLDVSRVTIWKRIKKYDINIKEEIKKNG
ncbi:sigma 54-interacting transcriptional regulator [Desulfococcaceae bacterium HSG7]|nr:sigma 54-interacting transcriptional regulator [Desulfococcaceae bacterium HSG9]MDM8553420.1 sigma 54-interacting transcriptional regulator [Desulfococcaceae bacterium HSG7]